MRVGVAVNDALINPQVTAKVSALLLLYHPAVQLSHGRCWAVDAECAAQLQELVEAKLSVADAAAAAAHPPTSEQVCETSSWTVLSAAAHSTRLFKSFSGDTSLKASVWSTYAGAKLKSTFGQINENL